jgi:hypothetical protein
VEHELDNTKRRIYPVMEIRGNGVLKEREGKLDLRVYAAARLDPK